MAPGEQAGRTDTETAGPDRPDAPALSRKEQAYQSLRRRILTDGFHPGALIDDALEAETLGMSRTPVREALLLLEAEGLVEMMPRRGVRVVPISRSDIKDVLVVLTALEVAAVGLLVAQRPTPEMLKPLQAACRAMERALDSDDPDEWLEADEAFHRGLLVLSGNRHLAETGIRFRDKIRRGHFVASRLLPRSVRVASTRTHKDLISILTSDRPEDAIAAHSDQRRSGEKEIMGTLDRAKLDSL